MTGHVVVSVRGLGKAYGALVAVNDVSFEVAQGEIFGMVGPNGAGKTTTIECMEGLRRPDGGRVRVLGLDPASDGYALRPRMGAQLQTSALPERMRVWEALDLFASFYPGWSAIRSASPPRWRSACSASSRWGSCWPASSRRLAPPWRR